MYKYKAKVIRVVDGDTVDLDIDLGFYVHTRVRGRLLNVDTPERGHPDWSLATRAFAELLMDEEAKNEGYIYISTTKTGKYGRWLIEIDGVNSVLAERWPYE